jgi:uncharacterized protein YigE (DUF2233 family)
MYKVKYYISSSAVRFKSFESFHEATLFANKLKPIDSVIEIKYYDDVNNKKPDRN